MSQVLEVAPPPFVERRSPEPREATSHSERRQFSNSHDDLSPLARELAQAVDQYKLVNRRRFITYEEMLDVILGLGYKRDV